MNYTSFIKLALFAFATCANILYAQFLLNPLHAENLLLYALAVVADTLTILLLSYTWISCFYFELFKSRYYLEITLLKERGASFLTKPVAVLVPVVNESTTLIYKTLRGILDMDGKKKVYLLDDGKNEEFRQLSEQLGITYLTRTSRRFNKAGNINNALSHVNEAFVAVFDADFVPKKEFLRETLPLFSDETIGIVQTPQVYYNDDNFFSKGFQNFQNLFYRYIMPAKSLQNSGICVGTNVVYRKKALDAIGGIPLVDHSEDINTSLKMYEVGYRTFYLDRELAKGLSPDNVVSFFNQQFRWSKGGLTMLFRNSTLFNSKLTLDQRIQFFFSNLFYLSGVTIFIYLITPLLAIMFNSSAINPDYFLEWVQVYALFFIANFVFYSFAARKNLLASVCLGIFCYVPYTKAIAAVLFNRQFHWKATNSNSSDVVTKLMASFFPYLVSTIAILYLFATGVLVLQTSFLFYAFWMGVNTFIILYLLVRSYLSVVGKKQKREPMQVRLINPIVWQPA